MAMKTVRAPMPRSKRAAQFAMFDALKGLKEAIKAKERIVEPRRILAEDAAKELNDTLCSLEKGQIATLVFYSEYDKAYRQITGAVGKIDLIWKNIQIGSQTVAFPDLLQISA